MLFDNISSYKLHVENRQDSGTGHGWSGAQTLFWNSQASGDVICDTPKWAMNWSIGVVGTQAEGSWAPEEDACWWESHNSPIEPRSLYLKQLEARLGATAVQNITTAEQRQGRLWNQLKYWAGSGAFEDTEIPSDPTCETGILNGNVCCLDSCGDCGGQGCGSWSGGASGCCVGTITDAGNSCESNIPPCLVGHSEPLETIGNRLKADCGPTESPHHCSEAFRQWIFGAPMQDNRESHSAPPRSTCVLPLPCQGSLVLSGKLD